MNKRRDNDHGTSAERNLSKRIGAKLTPASGALQGAKSDMVLLDFRLEAKATIRNSLSIQLSWLNKIHQEALETQKIPALGIQFVNAVGNPKKNGSWVCIPEKDFKILTERYSQIKEEL